MQDAGASSTGCESQEHPDVLAGAVIYGQEGLLCADMDLSDKIQGKYDLDVVGHYARPDLGVQI
jgi:hypothetical protein